MMFWDDSGVGWWGHLLMIVTMVVFSGLIIAGIVALVRYVGREPEPFQTRTAPSTPEEILAARFARGELDEEEYRRRLDVLRSDRRPVTRP